MNHIISGEVTLNDLPIKQRLLRFVEKKISQWLAAHPEEVVGDDTLHFQVSFTEDGPKNGARQVSCATEIHVGNHIYRGADLASDTQQALLHSLKHLHGH